MLRHAVEIHARNVEVPEHLGGVNRILIPSEHIVAGTVIVARSANDRQGKAADSDLLPAVRNREFAVRSRWPPDVVIFTTEGGGPYREPFGCSEQCVDMARTARSGIIPGGHLGAAGGSTVANRVGIVE